MHALCCAAAAGPLNAVVQAQAQAAQSTVNFIRQAGFNDRNETINARFMYTSTNATTGDKKDMVLSVPVLTLLPIPYLRVREQRREHCTEPCMSFIAPPSLWAESMQALGCRCTRTVGRLRACVWPQAASHTRLRCSCRLMK
jgi:hypothetical protein